MTSPDSHDNGLSIWIDGGFNVEVGDGLCNSV